MQERRKFPRVDLAFQVSILPEASAEGKNLSQEGIGFHSKTKCEIDSIIDLQLHTPGFTGDVDIKGKVVRCEPYKDEFEIGVVFVDIEPETEQFIYEFIDSKMSILS